MMSNPIWPYGQIIIQEIDDEADSTIGPKDTVSLASVAIPGPPGPPGPPGVANLPSASSDFRVLMSYTPPGGSRQWVAVPLVQAMIGDNLSFNTFSFSDGTKDLGNTLVLDSGSTANSIKVWWNTNRAPFSADSSSGPVLPTGTIVDQVANHTYQLGSGDITSAPTISSPLTLTGPFVTGSILDGSADNRILQISIADAGLSPATFQATIEAGFPFLAGILLGSNYSPYETAFITDNLTNIVIANASGSGIWNFQSIPSAPFYVYFAFPMLVTNSASSVLYQLYDPNADINNYPINSTNAGNAEAQAVSFTNSYGITVPMMIYKLLISDTGGLTALKVGFF